MARENVVISLGGSLVVPSTIDTAFLKVFKNTIKKHLTDKRFFIFVGGGRICRQYQAALQEFGADNNDRDWLGIEITDVNAKLVKQVFGDLAFSEIIKNPTKKISTKKDIVVASGWKPGWSTDYCAVTLAKNMGIKTIINLSDIDYIYDKDPDKFKNAKPLKEVSWKDFKKIIPSKWRPGLSSPFDPRASRDAEILKIKVAIMNGRKMDRVENFLNNKPFIGTLIHD